MYQNIDERSSSNIKKGLHVCNKNKQANKQCLSQKNWLRYEEVGATNKASREEKVKEEHISSSWLREEKDQKRIFPFMTLSFWTVFCLPEKLKAKEKAF